MSWLRLLVVGLLSAMLFACAKPKPDDPSIDKSLTPARAVNEIENTRGHKVRWGGVIISSNNLKDRTQLEVLAYPLDEDGRPQRDETALGRFLATTAGYIETVDYAPGRLITVTGQLQATRANKLGEADYVYPVIGAEDLKLWQERAPREDSRVRFGVGIGIGL